MLPSSSSSSESSSESLTSSSEPPAGSSSSSSSSDPPARPPPPTTPLLPPPTSAPSPALGKSGCRASMGSKDTPAETQSFTTESCASRPTGLNILKQSM